MGLMLLPSVPSLVIDLLGAVLTTAYTNFGHERDVVFCIQTEFAMEGDRKVEGQFLLLPDVESLEVILRNIRLA
jgi:chemotaxis protein CheC